MIEGDRRSAYVDTLLAESREEVERADFKASILLAAAGVLIAAFLGGCFTSRWSPADVDPIGARVVVILGLVTFIIAVVCLGAAVMPRTGHGENKESLAYFGHVVQFGSSRGWRNESRKTRDHEGRRELYQALESSDLDIYSRNVDQLWVISNTVNRKYQLIRSAIWAIFASLALFFSMAIWIST
jgi:hypothetical protein